GLRSGIDRWEVHAGDPDRRGVREPLRLLHAALEAPRVALHEIRARVLHAHLGILAGQSRRLGRRPAADAGEDVGTVAECAAVVEEADDRGVGGEKLLELLAAA